MKNNLKLLTIIIAIGIVLSVAVSLVTTAIKVPTVTEQDFQYSVTYKLNGKTETLDGVYRVRFDGARPGENSIIRDYTGEYLTNTSEYHPAAYTIAEKDGLELCVITVFSNRYLMGDAKNDPAATWMYTPYLAVIDQEGMEYEDEEMLGKFNAELISYELPEPVENSFVFDGFSALHGGSMVAMLIVGVLVIVACLIFVKKDAAVSYTALDKVSVVLNFVIAIVGIPFAALIAYAAQVFAATEYFIYQMGFCVPVIMAFTVAASLSLRRKGYAKSGLFVQLVGPVLFAISLILEQLV